MPGLSNALRSGVLILLAVAAGRPALGQLVSVAVGLKPSCPYGLAA